MGWLPTPHPPRVRLTSYQKTKNGIHFNPSQVCPSVPSFVLALLFIPSFHVLRGYFLCFTQFGGSFYSQNVDKFCDAAPLITRTITDPTELYSALTIVYNYPVDKCFIFRFHDAGYYFWKLSVQCLDLVSGAGSLVTSIRHLHDYVILLRHQWAKQIWPH